MTRDKTVCSEAVAFKDWLSKTTYFSPTTISNYYYVIKKLVRANTLGSIDIDILNQFIVAHNKENFNAGIVRAAIINFLKWQNRGAWKDNIIKLKSKGIKKPPSDITYEQLKKLFGQFPDEVCNDVFCIQAWSGCRQVEAWLIEKKNVQYRDGYVLILIRQKGGKIEPLILSNVEEVKLLFGKKLYRGKRYPFLDSECQGLSYEEILIRHYDGIRKRYQRAWKTACDKAGLPQYRSHDSRRAIGRAVYNKSGIYAAQKVLRHKSINMTSRYIEGMKIDIANALRKAME